MILYLLLLVEACSGLLIVCLHDLDLVVTLCLASLPVLNDLGKRAVKLLDHLVLLAVSLARHRQLLLTLQKLGEEANSSFSNRSWRNTRDIIFKSRERYI